jgi:hypothetical protein
MCLRIAGSARHENPGCRREEVFGRANVVVLLLNEKKIGTEAEI